MSVFLDYTEIPVLFADYTGQILITPDGEIKTPSIFEIRQNISPHGVIICHRKATEAKTGIMFDAPLDILELFAFIRPSQFCLPTPSGLATKFGQAAPKNLEDKALILLKSVGLLLDELEQLPPAEKDSVADIAEMMGKGGWLWAGYVLTRLGRIAPIQPTPTMPPKHTPPDGSKAAIWTKIPEFLDYTPRHSDHKNAIGADQTQNRLAQMLGKTAEVRQQQSDYAHSMTAIFDCHDDRESCLLLLAEAGTGTGKTLGYLAPASLWAEANNAPVWISTYTRNLQHQIADELSRLYPSREVAEKKVIIRKGRENYLCLLNLQEALFKLPGQPADATALGLMARWAATSPDGDLTGSYFPSWLTDLIGYRLTIGLSDRRGECIHNACPHYHKCFVEKSARQSVHADIVIANHALVMTQAALSHNDGKKPPFTRLIFDEGHHVFNAADNAFNIVLSIAEAAELRLWIKGGIKDASDSTEGRKHGLYKRLEPLLSDNEDALDLLHQADIDAEILPSTGWRTRLASHQPKDKAEAFFHAIANTVYARNINPNRLYDLQANLYPATDEIITAGIAFAEGLKTLAAPIKTLIKTLQQKADTQTEPDDSQRKPIESLIRSLTRRADQPITAWINLLDDLIGKKDQQESDFVDWIQIDRRDEKDINIGVMRHWLDPSYPFAKDVISILDGAAITSATLRDDIHHDDDGGGGDDDGAGWQMSKQLVGATHLDSPAIIAQHDSPFDYSQQTRIFIIQDIDKKRLEHSAQAMAELIQIANGGVLGLFTSIQRLKQIYPQLKEHLKNTAIPLLAQHIDAMNLHTLLHIFREEVNSVLIGTDAVRDGVDVPGRALQMMIYDRVPWPRPDMLYKARCEWLGRDLWTDHLTRMKLRQAFGRLIRRRADKGVFVMLDNRLPTRLTSAFPKDAPIIRTTLADAIAESKEFLR